MFCPKCGNQVPDGAAFCASCGYALNGAAPMNQAAAQQSAPKEQSISIVVLKNALAVMLKKPFLLWGLSLLCSLLGILALATTWLVPIVWIAISLVLSLGMEWVYLDGYRGKEVNSKQLFAGFKDFKRSFAVMGWRELWLLIWMLIPYAGSVFVVIKQYAYLLTPFLVRDNEEISAADALKESMKLTNGYKGKMFLTDLIVIGVCCGAFLTLGLLSLIPFIGVVFTVIMVLLMIVVAALFPLFAGLVRAAWYDEITKG